MHEYNLYNKDNNHGDDESDVATKFSDALDEIPGFRERNTSLPVIEWVQANQTRTTATWVAGASIVAGLATYVSLRIFGTSNSDKTLSQETANSAGREKNLRKAS